MTDKRTPAEKALWDKVGPPLYYCNKCMLAVTVKVREGQEPEIKRPCGEECGEQIIAPRKAIAVGEGGMNFSQRITLAWWKIMATVTGRCA